MLINSFELDAYVSFILWGPLVAEQLFSAVLARQWRERRKAHYPILSHPLSCYPDYSELSSSLLKWKLQFPKVVVGDSRSRGQL